MTAISILAIATFAAVIIGFVGLSWADSSAALRRKRETAGRFRVVNLRERWK